MSPLVFLGRAMLGALAFYTCLPISQRLKPTFQGVSCFAPLVGGFIGLVLWGGDVCFERLTMPVLTRSAVLVMLWLAITGGLHLDGAMDTADGLAVMDPKQRLNVMADSRTGAFGVMAAIAILALKITALTDLTAHRGLALVFAASWGRWGQQVAIASYPYLKPTGKGAFHKMALPSPIYCLPALVSILILHMVWVVGFSGDWLVVVSIFLGGGAIALITGYFFYWTLKGQTGDTYGAIVEWTEAMFLVLFTLMG